MLQKTRGIVLKYHNYSESSIVVRIYTEAFGLRSFIIKGIRAKSSKSKLALYQPLTLLELEVNHRGNKNIQYVKETRVAFAYNTLPFDVVKRSLLFFIDELLYRCLREEAPDKPMFDWLFNALTWLDLSKSNIANYHIVFMLQLSKFLGFYPKKNPGPQPGYFDLREGSFKQHLPEHPNYISDKLAQQLARLLELSFESNHEMTLTNVERRKILDVLIIYYRVHLPGFGEMKSVEILHAVLN